MFGWKLTRTSQGGRLSAWFCESPAHSIFSVLTPPTKQLHAFVPCNYLMCIQFKNSSLWQAVHLSGGIENTEGRKRTFDLNFYTLVALLFYGEHFHNKWKRAAEFKNSTGRFPTHLWDYDDVLKKSLLFFRRTKHLKNPCWERWREIWSQEGCHSTAPLCLDVKSLGMTPL